MRLCFFATILAALFMLQACGADETLRVSKTSLMRPSGPGSPKPGGGGVAKSAHQPSKSGGGQKKQNDVKKSNDSDIAQVGVDRPLPKSPKGGGMSPKGMIPM